MKTMKSLRLFLIVLICTSISLLAQTGIKAVSLKVFETTDGYIKGTYIAGIPLQGKVKEQAIQDLEKNIARWKQQNKIMLFYQDNQLELPLTTLTFDVEDSVLHLKNGKNNPIEVTSDKREINRILQQGLGFQVSKLISVSQLQKEVERTASSLDSVQHSIDLSQFISNQNQDKIIASTTIPMKNIEQNLNELLVKGKEISIKGNSLFSLSQFISDKNIQIDNQSLSIIASSIYQLVLQSNFQLIQRDISTTLPEYAQLGKEVRVEKGVNDFKFYNGNNSEYQLLFNNEGNGVTVSLKGLPFINSYSIDTSEQKTINPKTIKVKNEFTNETNQNNGTLQSGLAGQTVKVYRNVYDLDGNFIKKEFISEDTYLPINEIVMSKEDPTNVSQNTSSQNGTTKAQLPDPNSGVDGTKQDSTNGKSTK